MRSPIRVLHVPADHGYVRHVVAPGAFATAVADPIRESSSPDGAAAGWRPPIALDPGWIAKNAGQFDVFHLHFGFEHLQPNDLDEIVAALARAGRPLVYTAHDLRNPHERSADAHAAHLAVLCAEAAEIITLTRGAAREIQDRWGRVATVVPHPFLTAPDLLGLRAAGRAAAGRVRIGVHLKSLRPNIDALATLGLLRAAHALPSGREGGPRSPVDCIVRVSEECFDRAFARYDPRVAELLTAGRDEGVWTLETTAARVSETNLWEFLSSLDALVLPYRWGTHSGWVESCFDVGTDVIAPPVGHVSEQHPIFEIPALDDPAAPAALRRACEQLALSVTDFGPPGCSRTVPGRADLRCAERLTIAAAHDAVYRRALGVRSAAATVETSTSP